jgi:Fe-Mn family superoxide dismutase
MDEKQRFSDKQLDDHFALYKGYVNKRNEIDATLATTPRTNQNITFSPFRGLKISETFARNGALLHELYFENIKAETTVGKQTLQAILENFDSLEAFKDDLMACAKCARGWAITCYNLDDGRIQNYVLDAHNEKVPMLVIPLLVLDTYEHAYMIDFGINRAQYLEILWNNINWDIVEERVIQWIGGE